MRISLPLTLLLVLAASACGGETPAPTTPTSATSAAPTAAATTATPAPVTGTAMLTSSGSAGSKKAERRTNPAWTSCHQSFKPTLADDLSADVDKLAKACAELTKMHLLSETFKGTQSATNIPQSYKFKAQANHCYRAYAAAAPGIKDLDLLIKDSTGAVAGEDATDDPSPVVLEDGAVCFNADDDATVVVSVGGGAGNFAVQVWSD